jgi:octaprenyl-diphosphate synthase
MPDTPTLAPAAAPGPVAYARFLDLIADKLAATEEVFRVNLGSDVPFIAEAGSYIAGSGGKRMRPALLLLASRLLGHDSDEEVTYAAVVELIHTATLIHDDIIDHAAIRRGQTTLNNLWGNSLTVLLGDWLYSRAMQMALSHGNLEVVRALCDATLRMTEGELLALRRLGAADVDADEYFAIIERKTACLFAASCALPALIDPYRPEAETALRRYGRQLGICFQLVDDLLDFTASEREVGKPVLSDLKEGKLTLPLILALPRVDAAARRKVEMVLEDRAFERVAPDEILALVRAQGTLGEVEELAERSAVEAREALEAFPHSPAREALEAAPAFVLHRRS